MTDRERYIKARKEARRYQRKYAALKKAIADMKQDIRIYEADCNLAESDKNCIKCNKTVFDSVINIIDKHTKIAYEGAKIVTQAEIHDLCYETGNYNNLCDCATCIHRDECSGNDKDED